MEGSCWVSKPSASTVFHRRQALSALTPDWRYPLFGSVRARSQIPARSFAPRFSMVEQAIRLFLGQQICAGFGWRQQLGSSRVRGGSTAEMKSTKIHRYHERYKPIRVPQNGPLQLERVDHHEPRGIEGILQQAVRMAGHAVRRSGSTGRRAALYAFQDGRQRHQFSKSGRGVPHVSHNSQIHAPGILRQEKIYQIHYQYFT